MRAVDQPMKWNSRITMQFGFATVGLILIITGIVTYSGATFINVLVILFVLIAVHASYSFGRCLFDENFREREEQYCILLDEIQNHAIFMLDTSGRIMTWNAGAERLEGYGAEQIIGQSFSCFFPPDDIERGRPERVLQLAAYNGRHEEQRMRVRKGGSQFIANVTLIALHDVAGRLHGFWEISHDLSESKESEAKYRGLLEAAPDAMVVVNQGGEIVLLNLQAEKQFGYYRDELIGQKVINIIPDGFAERLIADGTRTAADALAQQIGTGIELTGRHKSGGEFPIEIMLSPLESAEGILVTAAIRDISVRKSAEKHLAQMEGQYRGLLEAAPDAMVVVNQDGVILLLNLQAEKQFGYRRDELVGQKVKNIIPEGFAERLIADGLRSAEDARTQQIGTGIELTARRKDGSEFPIEIMLSPLEGADGILVTAAIRDISVRKHMERLKDEFVSTVSHELRTPLTSIAGSLGLLMGQWAGKLPESAARLLAIAHKNSQRLVRLTNDILDIEKIEAGCATFNLGRIDVYQLLEQTIESNRGFAEGYGVHIRFDAALKDSEVNADSDRLAQVVTNLLSNAIKFSPPDGEVVVAVEANHDIVHISVRDHGPGVPSDFKPHVFDKFAQADATNSRQKGGTGLGLSIVKQIVERLGGQVGFDDAPGGGTIFHIDLPRWIGSASWEIDLESASDAARILLCEDDRDLAIVMREQLRAAGFAADLAHTASAAMACSAITAYAAILTDLNLPDSDGIEFVLRLRKQTRYLHTPVIVVSCDADKGREDIRAVNLNILGWLSKPVNFEQLTDVLRASITPQSNERSSLLRVNEGIEMRAAASRASSGGL